MSGVIYAIRCQENGRQYIGATIDLPRRRHEHRKLLRGGKHYTSALQDDWDRFGESGFEYVVLESVDDDNFLLARERMWLQRAMNPYNDADWMATVSARATRSANAARLWADPAYRARAVAARVGWASNKGYRCTPAQIANRARAGRINAAKRIGGDDWIAVYRERYGCSP